MVVWKPIMLLVIVVFMVQVSESRSPKPANSRNKIHQASKSGRFKPTDPEAHPGWIDLGDRKYKIYSKSLSWSDAADQCKSINTTLAILDDREGATKLTGYLSKLQTAWIDAAEDVASNGKKGCLMLDQHADGKVPYVRAPCNKARPYICHKGMLQAKRRRLDIVAEEGVHDMTRKHYGYRAFHEPASWSNAKKKCESFSKKYDGKLLELRNAEVLDDFRHMMLRYLRAVKHVWLGGNYENDKWYWISDKKPININLLHKWMRNESDHHPSEMLNTCLNMDRGNFIQATLYGSKCSHPQVFICLFPADKFKQLKEDEKEEKMKGVPSRRVNQLSKRRTGKKLRNGLI